MENEIRFIKPQKGVIVRDPISHVPLSENGEWKPFKRHAGVYWKRRIEDGTVYFADLPEIKQEETLTEKQVDIKEEKVEPQRGRPPKDRRF